MSNAQNFICLTFKLLGWVVFSSISHYLMQRCMDHTAWAPEGRSQTGPKGRQTEVRAQRAPRLLVLNIKEVPLFWNMTKLHWKRLFWGWQIGWHLERDWWEGESGRAYERKEEEWKFQEVQERMGSGSFYPIFLILFLNWFFKVPQSDEQLQLLERGGKM